MAEAKSQMLRAVRFNFIKTEHFTANSSSAASAGDTANSSSAASAGESHRALRC